MAKHLFKVLTIIISFSLISCAKSSEKKIRLVDMQGKAHNVKTRVPELNAGLLQSQNAQNSQAPSFSSSNLNSNSTHNQESYVPQSNPGAQQSLNKYANADYAEASANIIEQTLQAPYNPNNKIVANDTNSKTNENAVKNNLDNGPKILATIGQKQDSEVAEYSLNESTKKDELINLESKKSQAKKSQSKKSQEKTFVVTKKVKNSKKAVSSSGFFVQVGAFSNSANAQTSLSEMQKFSDGKIEEADLNDKKLYRVLLGPVSSKSKALQLMNEIKSSGHDAVIVRQK
ncbi:MAG: SPOR domain-containing protein [Pelagibacterales bacterium]|nr:SPOR domain-containing protein [Pelagibacterales bacterium]